MKISVVVPTYREGGLSKFIETLAAQTFTDYELILSDELYDKRHKAIVKEVQKAGIKHFKHVKAPADEFISVAVTINFGLRASEGELIVLIGDYSWIPRTDFLEQVWKVYKNNTDLTTTHPHIDVKDFDDPTVVFPEDRERFVLQWFSLDRGLLFDERVLGIISIPRRLLVDQLNGFCEGSPDPEEHMGQDIQSYGHRYGKGHSDRDVAIRAQMLGHRFLFCADLPIYRVAHLHGALTGVFADKKAIKTPEQNKQVFLTRMEAIRRGVIMIDGHVGISDRRWKNKNIFLVGGGASYCTRNMRRVLRLAGVRTYEAQNGFTGSASDIIWYGVSPGDLVNAQTLKKQEPNVRLWFWWTGTDAYNLINGKFGLTPQQVLEVGGRHLAVHERLRDELRTVGIEAEVLLDVPDDAPEKNPPLPEKPGILVYWQGGHPMFLEDQTRKVIEAMPKVKFHIIGAKPKDLPSNCVVHGWVDDLEKALIYERCIAYLTLMKHGGISFTGIELARIGRFVLTTWKYKDWLYAKGARDAIPQLRKILKDHKLNTKASATYRKFTVKSFVEQFEKIVMGRGD